MFYKLHSKVFCCGVMLLMSVIGTAFATTSPAQNQTAAAMSASNTSSKQEVVVNINSADVSVLQKAKGMSKKKAQAIVEYRDKNGPFKSLEDLLKVNCRGINKKWLDKVGKFFIV